jgi:hypothetical protein
LERYIQACLRFAGIFDVTAHRDAQTCLGRQLSGVEQSASSAPSPFPSSEIELIKMSGFIRLFAELSTASLLPLLTSSSVPSVAAGGIVSFSPIAASVRRTEAQSPQRQEMSWLTITPTDPSSVGVSIEADKVCILPPGSMILLHLKQTKLYLLPKEPLFPIVFPPSNHSLISIIKDEFEASASSFFLVFALL